ncbi:tetratricopeptide repeat protein [Trichocoleus sp. Lan]
MGVVFFSLEEYKQTIEFYEKALDIWRQISNQQSEALTLDNLEKAYRALGDYEKAIAYNHQHLDIVQAALQELTRSPASKTKPQYI